MAKHNRGSRSEQSIANKISRANRVRKCSTHQPCGFWYAVSENDVPIERLSTMSDDRLSVSEHPLVTISLSDTTLDEEGVHAFTEAFYRSLGECGVRTDIGRYLPLLPAGITLMSHRDPWYMAMLQERFILRRSIRQMVIRYRVHHETIDRMLSDALIALRDCVLECERNNIAC